MTLKSELVTILRHILSHLWDKKYNYDKSGNSDLKSRSRIATYQVIYEKS